MYYLLHLPHICINVSQFLKYLLILLVLIKLFTYVLKYW